MGKKKPAAKKPKDRTVPAWAEEGYYQRLDKCRIMLSIRGYVGATENNRIRQRILRAREQSRRV